jgi:hypothetical protein
VIRREMESRAPFTSSWYFRDSNYRSDERQQARQAERNRERIHFLGISGQRRGQSWRQVSESYTLTRSGTNRDWSEASQQSLSFEPSRFCVKAVKAATCRTR